MAARKFPWLVRFTFTRIPLNSPLKKRLSMKIHSGSEKHLMLLMQPKKGNKSPGKENRILDNKQKFHNFWKQYFNSFFYILKIRSKLIAMLIGLTGGYRKL